MESIRERFGRNLRRLIEGRAVTFEDVGRDALGQEPAAARSYISTVCAGRKLPKDPQVQALAEYLGVKDISEFFMPVDE